MRIGYSNLVADFQGCVHDAGREELRGMLGEETYGGPEVEGL